jgi:hypothetical protein
MLQISRKFLALPFNQVFFHELKGESRYVPKVISYTHRLKPSRQLQMQQTIHIDLRKNEQLLFEGLSSTIKNIIQSNETKDWSISIIQQPSNEQLIEFQRFYNLHAVQNKLPKINRSALQTLMLLRDKGGLIVTRVNNKKNDPLCYRIYAVDGQNVMSLYSTGQSLLQEDETLKNAYYSLCWENMKQFRGLGYKLYDFGDVKDVNLLKDLNESFGGNIVNVFSGYITKSRVSNILLQINGLTGRSHKVK